MPRRKPTIRHKIRGLRIGLSEGQVPQDIMVLIRGRVDYRRDAAELFSLLFTKVPHGTMIELLRLIEEKLSWVDKSLADRVAKMPQHPRIMARPWGTDPSDTEPAGPREQMRLFE